MAEASYTTTIDIMDEPLESFHRWTGFNTHKDPNCNTRFQMRDFPIDVGMAILGYAILCDWSVKSRKLELKDKTNILYEVRGFGEPRPVPLHRQNCSEEVAKFLQERLIRSLDFLRACFKHSDIPHVHVICMRNYYIMSAVWRPYQNKLWMVPVDQIESFRQKIDNSR